MHDLYQWFYYQCMHIHNSAKETTVAVASMLHCMTDAGMLVARMSGCTIMKAMLKVIGSVRIALKKSFHVQQRNIMVYPLSTPEMMMLPLIGFLYTRNTDN